MSVTRSIVSAVVKPVAQSLSLSTLAFSPTDISGLELWLDASDASSITLASTKVAQIDDKSGNGFNFEQTTDSLRPQYTGTQNGLNVITFDGARYMGCSFTGISAIGGYSAFCVNQYTAPSNGVLFVTSSINARFQHVDDVFYSGGTLGNFGTFTDDSRKNECNQISLIFDGSLSGNENRLKQYLNGAQKTLTFTGTIPVTSGADSGTSYLGAWATTSSPTKYTGTFSEIIIYSSVLSDTDRQAVENYLIAKWGVV